MKKLLPLALGLLALASCSKKEDATPTPQLQGGTWTFQSEVITATPKSGGATTTSTSPIPVGNITIAFTNATNFTTTTLGQTGTGTYTYSANIVTFIPSNGTAVAASGKYNVSELSASKLAFVDNSEDATNRYVTTDTFTR